jgi:hypothetical protein
MYSEYVRYVVCALVFIITSGILVFSSVQHLPGVVKKHPGAASAKSIVCNKSAEVLVNYTNINHSTTAAKYAILYTGSLRTFHTAFLTQYRTLIQFQQHDVDVFAYINIPPEGNRDFTCLQLMPLLSLAQLRRLVVEVADLDIILARATQTWLPSYPYPKVQGPSGPEHLNPKRVLVASLHYLYSGWAMMLNFQQLLRPAHPYKLVVRIRPDLYFVDPTAWINLTYIDEQWHAKHPNFSYEHNDLIATPNLSHNDGINDQFGIMSWATAFKYFNVIKDVEYFCTNRSFRFHPETLLSKSLHPDAGFRELPPFYVPLESFYDGVDQNMSKSTGHASFNGKFWDYCLLRSHKCSWRPGGDMRSDFNLDFSA